MMRSLEKMILIGDYANPHEITAADVGRPFGESLSGVVSQEDIGKRVFRTSPIVEDGQANGRCRVSRPGDTDCVIQIESKEQRDSRRLQRVANNLGKGISKIFL